VVDTVIYVVEGDTLKRYVDQDGGNIGSGVVIAYGWSQYKSYFTGVVGEIFAISQSGVLSRFVDTGSDTISGGYPIGTGGWQQFQSVFYGGNNIIYAITPAGELKQYLVNGNANIGTGTAIGSGSWQNVSVVH
jgi:hypothetical protein